MLTALSISDLALVDALELDLSSGLTVLTGETGAGKSILLNALAMALGDRADAGLVRPGASRAEVHLDFDLKDAPLARRWLEEHDLDDAASCLVRRSVGADGRSKAFINGRPVTLQLLQELSSLLVEIHGQHAHLSLLKSSEQRRLLDEASKTGDLVAELSGIYQQWNEQNAELEQRRRSLADRASREELLRYQTDELEQCGVEDLDMEALTAEHLRLANVGRIAELGQQSLDMLYDGDESSVNRMLTQCLTVLRELTELCPDLQECGELIRESQIQLKEATASIRHQMDRLEADPNRLEWLEERIATITRLARKHQVRPEELGIQLRSLQAELAGIAGGAERVEVLEQSIAELSKRYREIAVRLSSQRQSGAKRLSARITALIKELGMPDGRFEIAVEQSSEDEMAPHGVDRIEFSVAANPGLPARPIGKVASGGELSRISLAIQVSAIEYKATPTLVFDEVDTGIGGGVAEIVGQKLRFLSSDRQVLCVTHLPQVAAQGHHHLVVEKRVVERVTRTDVRLIDPSERQHEIARMLGGVRITEQTLAHAAEMLTVTQDD